MFDFVSTGLGALSEGIGSINPLKKKKEETEEDQGSAFTSDFGGYKPGGSFDNYFKPGALKQPGAVSDGVGYQKGAAVKGMDLGDKTYEGKTEFAKMAEAGVTDVGGKGFDMEKLAQVLQSIKPQDNTPPINMVRTGGGGRYDKSVFENPLLTRELNALYNQPLYNKLT